MVNKKSAVKTVKEFLNECRNAGITFDKVFLFGSFTKGKVDEWSDIDVMLFSDKFDDNVFDNLKLYSKINIKYLNIETHPFPLRYLDEEDSVIFEMLQDSIPIS